MATGGANEATTPPGPGARLPAAAATPRSAGGGGERGGQVQSPAERAGRARGAGETEGGRRKAISGVKRRGGREPGAGESKRAEH